MKRILLALSLVATLAFNLAGIAQTAAPAADAPATPASATPATDAAPPTPAPDAATAAQATAPAAEPAVTDAAAPPADTAADAPATDAPAAETPALAGAELAATDAAQPASGAMDAAAPAEALQPGTIIPLIVMDDVPLTDAIRNLARQANINFVLDPKIPYGQIGADGKVTPQPSVTIRWEDISAEQALTALLNNYGLQMTEDPKSKIARVTVKDPAAPDPLVTEIIQLQYASPSNIVDSVKAAVDPKRGKVLPDVRTSQLVVIATEQEMLNVTNLIAQLDRQTRQVLIETRLIEVRINPRTKKGVDWTGTLGNQRVTFGNGVLDPTQSGSTVQIPGASETSTTTLPGGRQVTTTRSPNASETSVLNTILGGAIQGFQLNTASGITPNVGFLSADGVHATLSFLNAYSESKVLSAPRTVTLDNEEAKIEVGTLYPVVNTTAGTANTTGGSQITYSNLTVMLKVTPRISANDYVNLKVAPSVSRLGPKVASVVGGVENLVDSFLTRNVETRVMIPSGNTLVMGGLIQDEINNGNTKVPFLGDIPILGYLFRVDEKQRDKGNLVIFITPTIVQDEDFQPTTSTFLKTRLPETDSLEGDWSAWDSGKPKDWSKKKAVPQDTTFDDKFGQSTAPAGLPAPAPAPASKTAVSQGLAFDESLGQATAPSGLPAPAATASADR